MNTTQPIQTKPISQIMTDYIDENNFQHIDVYPLDDINSQGFTAAIFCMDTGKTFWLPTDYMMDERIQKVITDLKESFSPAPIVVGIRAGLAYTIDDGRAFTPPIEIRDYDVDESDHDPDSWRVDDNGKSYWFYPA